MKKVLSVVLVIVLFSYSEAAFEEKEISAKVSASGSAYSAESNSAFSIFLNPAGLADLTFLSLASSYYQLYELKEFSGGNLAFCLPLKSNIGLGIGLQTFGKSDFYLENLYTVAGGIRFKEKFQVGMSIKYLRISFGQNYPELSNFSLDVGVLSCFKDKFQLGGIIKNLNSPEFAGEQLFPSYSLGIKTLFFKNVFLNLDVYKEKDFTPQMRFGQETVLQKNFSLLFGFQTEPVRYSLGTSLNLANFNLDYAYLNQAVLGISHMVSLIFKLEKRK